ncbi:MAG: hypothetical protein AAFV53_33340 [Myxococcota bacterium]
MPKLLRTFADQRTQRQVVTLDGVKFQLRLQWNARTRGWYLSLYELDDTPIIEGQRLMPGSPPLFGYRLDNGPAGQLMVRGISPYNRQALGTRLQLLYYEAAELPSPTPDTDDLIVTAGAP